MTTPLAPDNATFSRMRIGGVDALAEQAYMFGVTRSVGVVEAQTFGTAGIIRQPGARSGSVRLNFYVADNATLFALPGSEAGLIVKKAAGATTADTYVASLPVSSLGTDVTIGEFRRFETDNSPTNGLPGLGMDHDTIDAAISAAEDGAEHELGAAAVGQQLLMWVDLAAFTGTDIDFQIEHDLTGFASPTDAFSADLTLTGVSTGKRSTIVSTAIADTFWRFSITGTFSSAEFLAGFAIT